MPNLILPVGLLEKMLRYHDDIRCGTWLEIIRESYSTHSGTVHFKARIYTWNYRN